MDFDAILFQVFLKLYSFVTLFCLGVETSDFPFSYNHTGSCGSRDSVFRTFRRLSPIDCLAECGLRSKCLALNHRRLYDNYCELLENTDVVNNTDGCMYIRRENIDFSDSNLMDCGCAIGEVCDRTTGACTMKECIPVRSINNGILFGNKYAVGDSYSIRCDDLYEPDNNISMATCMSDGQWNSVPICVLRACPTPTIEYGTLLSTDFRIGATLTYSCINGYVELNGVYTTTCQTSVQWDYQPTCIENACTHFTFDNGQIVGSDYSVGMTLPITCDTNYVEENGIYTVTCLTSRQWDYVPTCIENVCAPFTIQSGQLVGSDYLVGSSLTVTCDASYVEQDGVSAITCLASRQWDYVPTCIVNVCTPFTINNGQLIGSDYSVGSTLTVTCDANYVEENGASTISCWPSRQWDYVPSCIENVCTSFNVNNGQLIGSDNSVGSKLTISCNANYVEQNGISTITCRSSLQWSYVPTCITCESSWYILDGSCYFIAPKTGSRMIRTDAETQCANQGAYLAEIETNPKINFIREKLQEIDYSSTYGYWIGLTKTSGEWKWEPSGKELRYSDWAPGEPETRGEEYVIIKGTTIQWNDVDNDRNAFYICEKPAS